MSGLTYMYVCIYTDEVPSKIVEIYVDLQVSNVDQAVRQWCVESSFRWDMYISSSSGDFKDKFTLWAYFGGRVKLKGVLIYFNTDPE